LISSVVNCIMLYNLIIGQFDNLKMEYNGTKA
jgi:hypothetical protein